MSDHHALLDRLATHISTLTPDEATLADVIGADPDTAPGDLLQTLSDILEDAVAEHRAADTERDALRDEISDLQSQLVDLRRQLDRCHETRVRGSGVALGWQPTPSSGGVWTGPDGQRRYDRRGLTGRGW